MAFEWIASAAPCHAHAMPMPGGLPRNFLDCMIICKRCLARSTQTFKGCRSAAIRLGDTSLRSPPRFLGESPVFVASKGLQDRIAMRFGEDMRV